MIVYKTKGNRMFNEQIKLLEQFISDWDNVAQGNPTYDWSLDLGICSNCKLGFYTLEHVHGLSYFEAKEFLSDMWKDFPGYTGDVYHPICKKSEYLLMNNFTQHPIRLELAKHVLQFLKNYDNAKAK